MSAPTRRSVLAGAAGAAGALVAVPRPAWAAADQRPGAAAAPVLTALDRRIVRLVDAGRALEHVTALSEGIGPRIGGTASERAAADHIAAELESLGYAVRLEPFPVADKFLVDVAAVGADLGDDISWQAGASGTGALDATTTLEVVDAGTGLAPGEYPEGVAGKAVLLLRVPAEQTAQVQAAVAQGAAAVLLTNITVPERKASAYSPALGTVEAPVQVGVPVVGLAQVHGERIRARLAQGPLSLTLAVRAHRGLTSQNVLADQPARVRRADARMVMVTAHYDSVIGAPGANDDASGTSLCLELARVLRDRPSAADLRFGLWGSEEQGLIGSRFHVAQLDDAAAARIAAVFQNDMVATSWDPATRYWRLSVDGSDNTAVAAVGAAAERLGYRPRVSEPTARGASDHVPFFERGIASANFSWRGEVAPSQLEPSYHTPEDTVAYNISLERLQVSLELVGSAAAQVAGVR